MSNRPTFEIDARLFKGGIVLACIGAVTWMIGAVLSATALGRAARKWIAQLEESPSEMARRRLHQAKVAAVAGSKAWREEQAH
jgi:hypothetical protein